MMMDQCFGCRFSFLTRFTHQKYRSFINFSSHHYQSTKWLLAIPLHTYLPQHTYMHIVGFDLFVCFSCFCLLLQLLYLTAIRRPVSKDVNKLIDWLIDWLSSNTLVSINVVTLRYPRLVPGWVTVFWTGKRSRRRTSHPGLLRLSHPSVGSQDEYLGKAGEVKGHIACMVTYTSPCLWSWSAGWSGARLRASLMEINANVREAVAH